ncbi:MAG: pyridoxamine 5'-phosphate oxidase, partial [Bacteroidales bacterium]|nr:pyridoxamine 5'-phosphate oxidase [Bacteroidales bacterium]
LFKRWYEEAFEAKIFEPNAFAFATANLNCMPSVRMLLLKSFENGGFTFFTNYESLKAKHLKENPHAAMVFYWSELERQVRIHGIVDKISSAESDKYFEGRPVGSRLGAWASPQSQPIESREWLEIKHLEFREKFARGHIPRPENWGGYKLIPTSIEFWQGRPNRLHDRIQYQAVSDGWKIVRLAP